MKKDNEEKKQRGIEEGTVKKIVMGTMAGAVIIAILITFIFNKGGPAKVDEDVIEEPPKEEQLIEDDRDKILEGVDGEEAEEAPVEDTEEARVEKYWDTAKDELERVDEPVDESEEHMAMLAEDMQKLFNYLGQDFSEVEGDFTSSPDFSKSIAGQTESWLADNINTVMRVGYQLAPETAEWFYSDTDEVYQFAVSVKSEDADKEDVIISGNYNKDLRVFKVFRINGNIDFPELAT